MGCTSSTEVVTDINGNQKVKKKLGGAYPGQRRPQQQPYAPSASEFDKNGQAVAHFKAYGGGNALTLVKNDGTNNPQSGKAEAQFIEVTLPDGVKSGQKIHVQAPDGQVNEIVVPPGFGPGSTFTVEFAPEQAPPPKTDTTYGTTTPAVPPPTQSGNDGFAAGFNNPGWTPTAVPTNETNGNSYAHAEPDIQLGSSYPTTSATPVYNTAPQYPNAR